MREERKTVLLRYLGYSRHESKERQDAIIKNIRAAYRRIRPEPELHSRLGRWLLTADNHERGSLVGIEIECLTEAGTLAPERAKIAGVSSTYDGSVESSKNRDWQECRLIIRKGQWGRLYLLCDYLNSHGATVNKSCGLHVHLDARHLLREEATQRAIRLARALPLLKSIVPPSRADNSFCRMGYSFQDRYHAINGCALSEHGTIEVRLHSGTTDADKIRKWVELLQFIFNTSAKITSLDALLTSRAKPELKLWTALRFAKFNKVIGASSEGSEVASCV